MFGVAADNYFSVGSNSYYDGTNWRYKVSGKTATMYHQDTGRHEFFSAPSGTADAIISGWVNRFQINDTGGIAFSSSGNGTTGQLLSSNGVNAPSWLSISSLVVGVATTATQLNTIAQTANASYYPTFVDSNNASSTGEVVYTTSSFSINPSTKIISINSGVESTNTATGALIVNGGVGINGALNAITKSFNIGHPTKPGMTLRYGSLEGPEFGVYVRGRLKGSNKIELPEYWTKLVDPDTITVNLTPVGSHQKLYVEDIVNNTVVVGNENIFGKAVDCFYTVYAGRADIDKLQVESE